MLVLAWERLRRILHRQKAADLSEPQQRQNRELIPYDAETAYPRERTMSKSQRKRLRHQRKPCIFDGCTGAMKRSDVHRPYIKWFCNASPRHTHIELEARAVTRKAEHQALTGEPKKPFAPGP